MECDALCAAHLGRTTENRHDHLMESQQGLAAEKRHVHAFQSFIFSLPIEQPANGVPHGLLHHGHAVVLLVAIPAAEIAPQSGIDNQPEGGRIGIVRPPSLHQSLYFIGLSLHNHAHAKHLVKQFGMQVLQLADGVAQRFHLFPQFLVEKQKTIGSQIECNDSHVFGREMRKFTELISVHVGRCSYGLMLPYFYIKYGFR